MAGKARGGAAYAGQGEAFLPASGSLLRPCGVKTALEWASKYAYCDAESHAGVYRRGRTGDVAVTTLVSHEGKVTTPVHQFFVSGHRVDWERLLPMPVQTRTVNVWAGAGARDAPWPMILQRAIGGACLLAADAVATSLRDSLLQMCRGLRGAACRATDALGCGVVYDRGGPPLEGVDAAAERLHNGGYGRGPLVCYTSVRRMPQRPDPLGGEYGCWRAAQDRGVIHVGSIDMGRRAVPGVPAGWQCSLLFDPEEAFVLHGGPGLGICAYSMPEGAGMVARADCTVSASVNPEAACLVLHP